MAGAASALQSKRQMGKATRDHPPRRLLAASLVGGALTVLPMAVVPSFGHMIALGVLLGLASGGALTLCYTMGGLLVPPEHRATAFGFFSGAALFGGAISPAFAGLLARWQLKGIYYVDAAIFACLALALIASRREEMPSLA